MNTLILDDLQFGNTEQLARSVADKLAGYGTSGSCGSQKAARLREVKRIC